METSAFRRWRDPAPRSGEEPRAGDGGVRPGRLRGAAARDARVGGARHDGGDEEEPRAQGARSRGGGGAVTGRQMCPEASQQERRRVQMLRVTQDGMSTRLADGNCDDGSSCVFESFVASFFEPQSSK